MSLDPSPTARELRAMAARKGVAPTPSVAQERAKCAKAPSVRPWHPYRSKWEAEYSKHLDILKATNRIWAWDYESEELEIGVGAIYTPDFKVWRDFAGQVEFHEVKGYRRESAIVRIKAAALRYPEFRFVLVTKKDGQWVYHTIAPAAGGRVPTDSGAMRSS